MPDGPLGFAAFIIAMGVGGVVTVVKESAEFGATAVQIGTLKLYELFNPSFLDDKISSLSLRITTGFLRSSQTMSTWYSRRGLFYMVKGDLKKSLEDFSKAIEINQNNFAALFYNASCMVNAQMEPDYIQIEKLLEQALEAFDKQEAVGVLKQKFHAFEDSLSEMHNSILSTKDSLQSMLNTNVVAKYLNPLLADHVNEDTAKNKQYLTALVKTLDAPVTKTSVLNLKAVVLCKLEKYDKAITVFSTLMQQEGLANDQLAFYHFNFGLCYLYMYQYSQALTHFVISENLASSANDRWVRDAMEMKVRRFIYFLWAREGKVPVAPAKLVLIPYPLIKGDAMAIVASYLDNGSLAKLERTSREIYLFLKKNQELIRGSKQ